MTSGGLTRAYGSPREFGREASRSRIYAGVHFRRWLVVCEAIGDQVASRVLADAGL